jgi:amino acid permease
MLAALQNSVVLHPEYPTHRIKRLFFIFRRLLPISHRFAVPWDYPNLSSKTTSTSPFTIVFELVGSSTCSQLQSGRIHN